MTESEFWTQGHIGLPKRGLTEARMRQSRCAFTREMGTLG